MTRGVTLDARQRPALRDRSRQDRDPDVGFRAHLPWLLADGATGATVAPLPCCRSRTLDRSVQRCHPEGVERLAGHQPGRPVRRATGGVAVVVAWVTTTLPRDFGFLRGRWCRDVVALPRRELHQVEVRRPTGRRWLHRGDLVDRRPRPLRDPTDEPRERKRDERRKRLAELPADETAVFQDEVDSTTNPKRGAMARARGEPATVKTPGKNENRERSGSIPWRTGQVFLTEGRPKQGRDTAWLLARLDDLRGRLRRHRKLAVIGDQAKCHTRVAVALSLDEHRERIELHLLPAHSPDGNPIERVWWHLQEEVTRNHRCQSMRERFDRTLAWWKSRNPLKVEGSVDKVKAAA